MKQKKFRFWNGKEMVYVKWGRFVSDEEKIYYFDCIMNAPEGIVVMEDTGLKDKCGNSIYEGDLVKGNGELEDWIEKVSWDEDRAMFTVGCYMDQVELEIIGNIHQNSDLLA